MDSCSPVLVAVHDAGRDGVHVGARADEQQDDEQEGLEVEEGGLAEEGVPAAVG